MRLRCTVRCWSRAAVAWSSCSTLAGCRFLPALGALLKERLSAFGPPRDGFGLFLGLFECCEENAGEGLDGEAIGADDLDEFAEPGGLLAFDLLGLLHQGQEFGVEISRLDGHLNLPCLRQGILAIRVKIEQDAQPYQRVISGRSR